VTMSTGDDGRLPGWAEDLRALGRRDDDALAVLAQAFGAWSRAVALRPDERRHLWDRIIERGPGGDGVTSSVA